MQTYVQQIFLKVIIQKHKGRKQSKAKDLYLSIEKQRINQKEILMH